MRAGDWAWLTLTAGVVVYELVAPPGQLLSEMMDVYRAAHPLTINCVIVYLAGHLTRVWPASVDPLTVLASWWAR